MKYTRVDTQGKPLPQIEREIIIHYIADTDSVPTAEWGYIGVQVEVKTHNWLTESACQASAGIWAVEFGEPSLERDEYLLVIAKEQLDELSDEYPQIRTFDLKPLSEAKISEHE